MKKIKKHKMKPANHFRMQNVENLTGFATKNVLAGEQVEFLSRASLISDQSEFYTYIEQISNLFLHKLGIIDNNVFQLLILIHEDLTADIHINNLSLEVELLVKRDVKKGEPIRKNNIADIRRVRFRDIQIIDTDKIICCIKVGWKFGLFFDFHPQDKLNLDEMTKLLGHLYRYLSFQDVYKVLETEICFPEMMKDGWFPFVEIISDYKTLSAAYTDKFDFENRVKKFVEAFDKVRIEQIANKWWMNKVFNEKKEILQAGITAFFRGDSEGHINCIKNLLTEVDGIIRLQYFQETSKSRNVKVKELLEYIIEKGKSKSGSGYSLILPLPFFNYLKDIVFRDFDLEGGNIELSRHSSSHGVAKAEEYTKEKALQTILILDQIFFYIQ